MDSDFDIFDSFIGFYNTFYADLKSTDPGTERADTYIASGIKQTFRKNFKSDIEKLSPEKKKQLADWIRAFFDKDKQLFAVLNESNKNSFHSQKSFSLNFKFSIMYLQIQVLFFFIKKNKMTSEKLLISFLELYKKKMEMVGDTLEEFNTN